MTNIVLRAWPVAFPCSYEWGTGVLGTLEDLGTLIDRDIDPSDCALLTATSKWHVHAILGRFLFL